MPVLLIVDDQPDNLFVLTRVVESLVPGCEVVTASCAEKGLAQALEKNLDAALIDVQMPVMDGIEMCRRLKADPGCRHVPVILITSHGATAGLKARGLEAGADDFISRPIDNEELAARIKVALRIKKAEDDLRSLNARLESCVVDRTAELALANRQVEVERDHSRNVINTAPVIILELDPGGCIVTFNSYLEELSGYSLDEVRGGSWFEIFLPKEEQHRMVTVFEKTIVGDDTSGTINQILTKDGNTRDIIWFNRQIEESESHSEGLLSIGQDVTDIRRASEIQEVLSGILRAAIEENDLHALISRVRDELGKVIDTGNFYVALYGSEDETYRFPYFVSDEETIDPDERFSLPTSLTDYVRRSGKPLWIDDEIKADLERLGEVEMIGVSSRLWLGAPLETSDGMIGVVAVQSFEDPQLYRIEDLDLLSHVAGTIAIAIRRNQAEEQTTRLGRAMEDSLNEVYLFDAETLCFTQVNRGARENLGYSIDELKKMTPVDLVPEFTSAIFAEMIEPLRNAGSERLLFETVQRRKDHSLYPIEVHLSLISGKGRPVFIAVILDITERKKNEEELERYRGQLETMVEQRTGELTRAKEVTEGVNKILYEALTCEDEEGLSQLCLGVARRLTGAEYGFIGEINERGRMDTFALDQAGWDRCRIPETQASGMIRDMVVRGIWASVITSGHSQIIKSPAAHEDSVGIPEGHPELESFLGVPLLHAGRTFGLIGLANKDGGFTEADREAVEALATAFVQVLKHLRAESDAKKNATDRQKALNLMVGRELRMAELKNEIRELQKKVGVPENEGGE